ncbi:unnamed protein product [Lota lota]
MDDFDERLADEVRKHRRLYDNACPSRKNSKTTIATWKAIGNAVNEDPTVCMRRWKALRDKFVRLKKRIKTKKVPPGYEGAKVDVHVIHEKLSWLNEHVTHRTITDKTEVQSRPKREGNHLHGCGAITDMDRPKREGNHLHGCGAITDMDRPKREGNHLHGCGAVTDTEQSFEAMPSEAEECYELDDRRPPTHVFKTQIDGKRKMDNNDIADSVKRFDVLENHVERPNQEDAYDRYTQTVADFMRGLSRRRCVVFKKRLNDLMYEMDLEELDDFAQS